MSSIPPSGSPHRSARRVGLPAAIALAALVLAALPPTVLGWDPGTFNSASEQELYQLTNQARAAAGLRSLAWDGTLAAVARSRSQDMIVRNYFSHAIPPDGHSVFDELQNIGYCFVVAGENIGWNTYPDDQATAAIQSQFMASPSHRENILGAWDAVGIGAFKGTDGKKMWTVLFADRCGPATPKPTATAKATATPRPVATPKPVVTPKPTPPAATLHPTLRPTSPPAVESPGATPASPSQTPTVLPSPSSAVVSPGFSPGPAAPPAETAAPSPVGPDAGSVPGVSGPTPSVSPGELEARVAAPSASDFASFVGSLVDGLLGF
jgi:uncharacterized protein YkwD